MIKNYYYLITGILSILFSFTHAWNGEVTILPYLDIDMIAIETRTIISYVWHVISAENLLFGIAFLYMAFSKDLPKVRFAALVIALIIIVRWMVIFSVTLLYSPSRVKDILIDSIAIVIYISLIVLGIRNKSFFSKVKDNTTSKKSIPKRPMESMSD